MQVKVYNTRIEISPYHRGEIWALEKKWSAWVSMGKHGYYNPIAYVIHDSTLLIPRGMDLMTLKNLTGVSPTFIDAAVTPMNMKYKYHVTLPPRNNDQIQAIDFLLSKNRFERNWNRSQFALKADTGIGKTYCSIHAMISMEVKTLVITHNVDIKNQWRAEILKCTTLKDKDIKDIDGWDALEEFYLHGDSENHDVYLTTHSSIIGYANNNEQGWLRFGQILENLGIGLKIIDEVHLFFHNTVMIDLFTNIKKTFYLTATFNRSDLKEGAVFRAAFANTLQFGSQLKIPKHTNYAYWVFNSYPDSMQRREIKTVKGLSSSLYGDYSFGKDDYHCLERAIILALDHALTMEGRVLLVVPKIENMEYMLKIVKERYPSISSGTINSKHTKKENAEVKEHARIIIGTIRGTGTGSDIKQLRSIIVADIFSSNELAKQLIGRLRPYGKDVETYVYELVNEGFPAILDQIKKRQKTIAEKCLTVVRKNIL